MTNGFARAMMVLACAGAIGGAALSHAAHGGQAELAAWPVRHARLTPNAEQEARIAHIVGEMTLEQKIGQMTQAEIRSITPEQARQYYIGSILNGGGAWPNMDKHAPVSAWVALADAFYQASMTTDMKSPVPIIWGTDAVHGANNVYGATLFPHNIGLGAARDPALIMRIGRATARAVRAIGISWVFAPTIAVGQNQRWGRAYESYSSDPALVAVDGAALVRGLQGELGGGGDVVATAKHFIGDGGTFAGVDEGESRVSQAEMIRVHAAGYYAALDAGAQTVMASYNSWNDQAAHKDYGKMHGNRELLTGVLKGRMGFDGLVISDWNAIEQVPGCTKSHCPAAINAGVDLIMAPADWQEFIANTVADVRAGRILMARIDDAVTRILRVKMRAGLFGHNPAKGPLAGDAAALQAPDLAREAVRKSAVLLKNNGGILPLRAGRKLLVVGAAANSFATQSGGWSLTWQGNDNDNTDFVTGQTLLTALTDLVGKANIVYAPDGTGVDPSRFAAVVAVVGEEPHAEYKGDLRAPATLQYSANYPADMAVLKRVAGKGAPVVTVLYSGRTVYANDLINLSDAFVAAFLPGSEAGGLADLMVRRPDGKQRYDFSARLPFSWPGGPCADEARRGGAVQFALGYGLRYAAPRRLGRLPFTPAAKCAVVP
ncbi:MAG: glycoside hydrolase family 3 N-terminal domain-containing protein [Sphingomonas sp.]|jgi:beta-glucosidase